jgi:hypothetical protein
MLHTRRLPDVRFLVRQYRLAQHLRVAEPVGTLAAIAIGALVLISAVVVRSAAAADRVIDRTLLCTVAERAGVNVLELRVQSGGFQQQATPAPKLATAPASIFLWTGFGFGGNETELVRAAAGTGRAGSLSLGRICSPVKRRIPLHAQGLSGGRASRLETFYECFTPARVLVRVRAAFATAKPLRRDPTSGSLFARGTVRESAVAVRTLRGRPILFASLVRSGTARLFLEPGCFEDNN